MVIIRGLKRLCYEMDIQYEKLESVLGRSYWCYRYSDVTTNTDYYLVSINGKHNGYWGCDADVNHVITELRNMKHK